MIAIRNLRKSFEGREVLKGVDLEIPSGAVTVILGPSGEGKSVLLKHLIGLLKPDSGKIFVDGVEITNLDAEALNRVRRKFGMLFQSAALFDSMNVFDNVAFPLREHSGWEEGEIRDRVRECLAWVSLETHIEKMPAQLSGGMKKRVGLARAIALEPEIVLYDEPTTGLDPLTTEAINQLILDLQKKLGSTSVVISHDIESTFEVADHIAMLYQGRIVAEGAAPEFRKSQHPFVREFLERGRR